jgi:hypothetical protein
MKDLAAHQRERPPGPHRRRGRLRGRIRRYLSAGGQLITIAVIIGSLTILAVLDAIGWLIYRARSDRPGQPFQARAIAQLPPEPRPQLEGSHQPAPGPAREIHLHALTPDQLAPIIQSSTYLEENR